MLGNLEGGEGAFDVIGRVGCIFDVVLVEISHILFVGGVSCAKVCKPTRAQDTLQELLS